MTRKYFPKKQALSYKYLHNLHLGHLRSSLLSLALIVFEDLDDLFVNIYLTDSSCIICMNIICRYI